MDAHALHHRARTRGVNPLVYWPVRWVLIPFFRIYFRLGRIGREHIPQDGPLLLAANHRSFLDPFVCGAMLKRPVYYVAKKELFANRLQGWFLNALGAFPVDRGASDQEMLTTARAILDRGDVVLIFPEGTRVRPGGLGKPKRGIGRLALESGAPVVPLAVIGTEDVRRGWRIRPHRVTIRAGRPLTFPQVQDPSRQLAQAVTERIWPCVALQWEWLGGLAPLRRATVLGVDAPDSPVTYALRAAGLDVHTDAGALGESDLVVLASDADTLQFVLARHGDRIPRQAGVLVLDDGRSRALEGPPAAFVAERVVARAIASLDRGAHVASTDRAFAAQLEQLLEDTTETRRVRAVA
jgi:glycerol-3-phosphate dehydrogenase (NAD(P)+)